MMVLAVLGNGLHRCRYVDVFRTTEFAEITMNDLKNKLAKLQPPGRVGFADQAAKNNSSEIANPLSVTFHAGDLVDADFGGEGTFFPGVVQVVRNDGTFDIVYDDGDEEKAVPSALIRLREPAEPAEPADQNTNDIDPTVQDQLHNGPGGPEATPGTAPRPIAQASLVRDERQSIATTFSSDTREGVSNELIWAFEKIDRNGDGTLKFSLILHASLSCFFFENRVPTLRRLLYCVCAGTVSREEFIRGLRSNARVAEIVGASEASGQRLNEFFTQIDSNSDAQITIAELEKHLASVYGEERLE